MDRVGEMTFDNNYWEHHFYLDCTNVSTREIIVKINTEKTQQTGLSFLTRTQNIKTGETLYNTTTERKNGETLYNTTTERKNWGDNFYHD